MGKLIKNHWARLIILTASVCMYISLPRNRIHFTDRSTDQVAAAVEGFFWPKIFWDFLTKNLDFAVKPLPILQIINLVMGIFFFAWEWPLGVIAGTALHRSIEARLVLLPLTALASALLYQATNPAIYYMVGMGVYFWAYSEGEVGPLKIGWYMNKKLTEFPDCGSKAVESSFSHPSWKSLDGLPYSHELKDAMPVGLQ